MDDKLILNALIQDFQALFIEKHLPDPDIAIECDCNVFNFHEVILSSRSPVLKAMIENPMQEKATAAITINDMDAEVLLSVVHFMYSGQVDIQSVSKVSCLLDAAEKYQVFGLKKGALEYMKSNLTENNAIKFLELADLHDEAFKKYVLKFVCDNYGKLKNSKDLNDLIHFKPSLALEVYLYLVELVFN